MTCGSRLPGRLDAARPRARAVRRRRPLEVGPARGRRGRGVPAARRPRPASRTGGARPCSAAQGIDVVVLPRGVARVPRVRAHGDDGRQRRAPPGVPRRTLASLEPVPRPTVLVMTSAGGLVPLGRRGRAPAALLLSGPAGGVRAAAAVAEACGFPTRWRSTWGARAPTCASCRAACPSRAATRTVGGLPDPPAGARHPHDRRRRRLDRPARRRRRAGRSGPRARAPTRARPATGAAATRPTVTDADLVLGRIAAGDRAPGARTARPRRRARGAGPRRRRRPTASSRSSTRRWNVRSRVVTVEQGVDPRDLALVAFGGAGPLHACAIADALGHARGGRAASCRCVLGRRARVLRPAARAGALVAEPRRTRRARRGAPRARGPRPRALVGAAA